MKFTPGISLRPILASFEQFSRFLTTLITHDRWETNMISGLFKSIIILKFLASQLVVSFFKGCEWTFKVLMIRWFGILPTRFIKWKVKVFFHIWRPHHVWTVTLPKKNRQFFQLDSFFSDYLVVSFKTVQPRYQNIHSEIASKLMNKLRNYQSSILQLFFQWNIKFCDYIFIKLLK